MICICIVQRQHHSVVSCYLLLCLFCCPCWCLFMWRSSHTTLLRQAHSVRACVVACNTGLSLVLPLPSLSHTPYTPPRSHTTRPLPPPPPAPQVNRDAKEAAASASGRPKSAGSPGPRIAFDLEGFREKQLEADREAGEEGNGRDPVCVCGAGHLAMGTCHAQSAICAG